MPKLTNKRYNHILCANFLLLRTKLTKQSGQTAEFRVVSFLQLQSWRFCEDVEELGHTPSHEDPSYRQRRVSRQDERTFRTVARLGERGWAPDDFIISAKKRKHVPWVQRKGRKVVRRKSGESSEVARPKKKKRNFRKKHWENQKFTHRTCREFRIGVATKCVIAGQPLLAFITHNSNKDDHRIIQAYKA